MKKMEQLVGREEEGERGRREDESVKTLTGKERRRR